MIDPSYAFHIAEEQYDAWAGDGLTNEAMIETLTGLQVKSASKSMVLDVIANAWVQLQNRTREAA